MSFLLTMPSLMFNFNSKQSNPTLIASIFNIKSTSEINKVNYILFNKYI